MRVKCLAQKHNTMSLARARTPTASSGVECTNHETTTSIRDKLDSLCEVPFVKLKQMLTDAPVSGFPDFSRGCILVALERSFPNNKRTD